MSGKMNLSPSFQGIVVLVVTVFVTSTMYMVSILEDARMLDDVTHINTSHINAPQQRQDNDPIKPEWTLPYVHIINTRFMQNQGNLTELARARLVLFETFCLETVLQQTVWKDYAPDESPPFLWVVKTDPNLTPSVRSEMEKMFRPYPFIYLVASNVNFGIGIHPGGWRGGEAAEDLFRSKIYTGDVEWLRQAYAVREDRAILETRLDADDGLNVRYIEVIHEEAVRKLRCSKEQLSDTHKLKWRYWCAQNHLEWSPTAFFSKTQNAEHGLFVPRKVSHSCITPGLTLGVSVGETEQSIPRFPHHELYQQLRFSENRPDCGDDTKCLRMMVDPLLGAIRSRTATSAGMKNVAIKEKEAKRLQQHAVPENHKAVEQVLRHHFLINLTKAASANKYLQTHMADIVEDNLQGQCTHGHSCKNSTRDALNKLLHEMGKDSRKKF